MQQQQQREIIIKTKIELHFGNLYTKKNQQTKATKMIQNK